MRRTSLSAATALAGVSLLATPPAGAQSSIFAAQAGNKNTTPVSKDQPVTFTADSVSYDREHGIVTATGHVEAWQDDHVIRADKISFDRNTNVVAATGHVVMLEPDGQVLFADYAELTQGMRDGVLRGMRALLASNGRLAANGARRTGGKINELSRAVYSTCNVCARDPNRAPLWQIRAYNATQDVEHKRIEYRDAYLDFFGFPVAYIPYFSHPDPSAKRASGFLVPDFGASDKHLGTFVRIPYYYVINDQSDVVLAPTLASEAGPQLETDYRIRLNNGFIHADGALAYDQSHAQGYIQAHGTFSYNETWRYGFDVNEASSIAYMRDFRVPGYGNDYLPSQAFVEGFGVGSYARLDVRTYQALQQNVQQDLIPYVLPRFTYSFVGQPDALGGRLSIDTTEFNVLRNTGTSDQRAALALNWDRPFAGYLGERYQLTLNVTSAAYNASDIGQQPNYMNGASASTAHAQPTAALKMNWPFMRATGSGGSQVIEPIVQLIAAPNAGYSRNSKIPNEDSLDYEFTDQTLFSINRWGGYDRFDGGLRANVGLHTNWTFADGKQIDALVGQSYREHVDQTIQPLQYGLGNHVSDIITRATFIPADWLDFTARGRFDKDNMNVHFADGLVSAGVPLLRVSGGYLYSSTNPYNLYQSNIYTTPLASSGYFMPRNEASLSVSSTFRNWTVSAYGRRDLATGQLVAIGADGRYENECFIFDINFNRRYTDILNDGGDSTLLFMLTFKTVGQLGFNG
ncbi:MAG TPA: LPS assembly protein LptD [Acetobacteraceae bacterium]|nr:LPS assembly protein LptD [Acetobacteraceae bacterium]